uniref:Degenerin-like protein unc-105-like n=1 Tax=Saccoglossus kowalevskii TaxID=10224 RepID=A0ABM0MJ64_SACKO|nr:PREDICTED: degenerin-like protein unc-105-like [Saccoglossus kowalevskii]
MSHGKRIPSCSCLRRPDVGDNDAFTLSTFSQDKSGRTNSENEKDISLSEDNSQHLEGAKNENKLQQADGETEHWYGIVKNFANSTTAHGLSHVVSSVSWSSRLAWTIILLAAATAFITQTLMLIIQYMEFNVNTKVALVSATERPFPSITVCNTNKLRRSALLKSRYREMLIVDSPLVLPHYGDVSEGEVAALEPHCYYGIHYHRCVFYRRGLYMCQWHILHQKILGV